MMILEMKRSKFKNDFVEVLGLGHGLNIGV